MQSKRIHVANVFPSGAKTCGIFLQNQSAEAEREETNPFHAARDCVVFKTQSRGCGGFAQERGAVLNSLRPQTSGAEVCITAREPSDR